MTALKKQYLSPEWPTLETVSFILGMRPALKSPRIRFLSHNDAVDLLQLFSSLNKT